jgi:hypothetical protein
MTTLLAYSHLIAGVALGMITEAGAALLGVWRYRSFVWRLFNVLVAFGLIQGLIVGWVVGGHLQLVSVTPVLFMIGAVVGVLLEGLNAYWWRAWTWSDKPLLGIVRPIDKAAFCGVAWGFAPVLSVMIARLAVAGRLEF